MAVNIWIAQAATPDEVKQGGALAWPGGDLIYALRGDRKVDFWGYSISGNSWQSLGDTPGRVDNWGALVHLSGEFFVLRGDDKKDFWKFTASSQPSGDDDDD